MWSQPLGPSVELPEEATKRCLGWRERKSRPLGPSVELPTGPRSAVLGDAGPCGHNNRGLRPSSLCATTRCAWCRGSMWSQPLGPSVELPSGHETLYWVWRGRMGRRGRGAEGTRGAVCFERGPNTTEGWKEHIG
eukprot:1739473-Pyramimonas_sp.AAC.1